MEVILFMILTTGEVKTLSYRLKQYEFCSDKVEQIIDNYKAPIQIHWCTTKDGEYYVSYFDPEFEREKNIRKQYERR